jgi:prepilin-type N-terminal cleavage/methylation domain-containing protein
MRSRKHSNCSGFTLVEMAIVTLIVSIMLGVIALFQSTNHDTLQQSAALGTVQANAHRTLERVLGELDGASVTRLVPDPTGPLGTDDLVFQKSNGVDAAGNVIWSSQTRLALVMEDGETLNGVDDNHNGLVDERKLTITHDYGTPQARTETIAHRLPANLPGEQANGADDNGNGVVDEKGFNIRRVGNLLSVRLAVQARAVGHAWATWTESSGLRLRN